MSDGWIKLYRELLDKPIWKLSTPEQKSILITLLLLASHEDNEWEWKGEKFTVNPGQFVTSLDSIKKAVGNGISIRNIRTALVRFGKLGFLTNKSTKMGRLVSIINWGSYQPKENLPDKDSDKGVTKTRQRGDTYQECKKVRMKEKDLKPIVEKLKIPFKEIIEYLNLKAGKNYRHTTPKTKDKIRARWNEGFILDNFKHVIDVKSYKWIGTKHEAYLRPETLFGTKFEGYLNERIIKNSQNIKVPTVHQLEMLKQEMVNQDVLAKRRQYEPNTDTSRIIDITDSAKSIT